MNKTLEQALRDNALDGLVGSQFVVRIMAVHDDHLDVYVRPENRDGETVDFAISGNEVTPYDQ